MGKKKSKRQHVEADAFDNPVARGASRTFEDESGPATFEDESRATDGNSAASTHLAKSELSDDRGASFLTQEETTSAGCCCGRRRNTYGGHTDSKSAVQFQAMQLMDAKSAEPQLHDHTGRVRPSCGPELRA